MFTLKNLPHKRLSYWCETWGPFTDVHDTNVQNHLTKADDHKPFNQWQHSFHLKAVLPLANRLITALHFNRSGAEAMIFLN